MKNTTRSLFRISHSAFRIICAVLALLCACGDKDLGGDVAGNVSPALADIDSMMWRQPDSAFVMLQAFASSPSADSLGEFDGHYFHLLLSELLYKNDYAQTNRGELLGAMEYFDSLYADRSTASLAFLDARSHYIKGVGYYETDSVVEACGEYFKALETMEGHFEEKEFVGKKAQFLSLTYNRLGELFSGQFMMESSIVCYEQAFHYCLIEPTSPLGLSRTIYFIGKQYDKMDDYEQARRYYGQALEELKSTDNCLYRDIVASRALSDYLSGFDTKRPFDDMRQILSQAADESERLNRYFTVGALFLKEKMYDSAVFYLEPVFESGKDSLTRIQTAEYLHQACLMTNDEAKAKEYARFLASHATESYDNTAITSKLEKAFQSFTNDKQRKTAAQEKRASVLKTLKTVVPTAIVLTALLVIVINRKNRKTLEMKESLHREEINRRQVEADTMLREKDLRFEEEKKTWEEQMAALRSEIGMLNEEVERRREELSKINTRNEEKSQLQKELREQEERLTALKNEIAHLCEGAEPRRKAFLEEPVCQKITGSLLGVHVTARNSEAVRVPFSKQDATALRDAVCRHYRSFDTLLSSKNPLMSEDDLLLCHLFLLGLNDRQVSVLMFKSYSAVKKHVNRLEKALKLQGKLAEFLLQITGF